MEGVHEEDYVGNQVSNSGGGDTPANSRWNPTKEQINMLESLYDQGVRTPTAEQIQEITGRLKAFGQIEGKNVFYWFQNHKARQRQKQKQEMMSMSFLSTNRYLHKPAPLFPRPCPNVVYSPYYQMPHNELGFYPQYTKVLLHASSAVKSSRPIWPDTVVIEKNIVTDCGGGGGGGVGYESTHSAANEYCRQETLSLFPLEPTGILQARTAGSFSQARTAGSYSIASTSAENHSTTATPSSSTETAGVVDEVSGDRPCFFDFFSGNGSWESDQ